MDNKLKGDIGEQYILLKLLEAGLNVLKPVGDRLPYDLVVEKNGEFKKIQCKYRALHGKDSIKIGLSNRFSSSSVVYSEDNLDVFAVFCPDTLDVCFFNMSEIKNQSELYVKVLLPKPGYNSGRYIKNYSDPNRIFSGEVGSLDVFTKKEYEPKHHIRKVIRPDKEILEKLIWEKPLTKIGKEYNVSDNAVRKWCKYYGITELPTRGYWQKLAVNKI